MKEVLKAPRSANLSKTLGDVADFLSLTGVNDTGN